MAMRIRLKLAALAMLSAAGLLATPAQAAGGGIWDHNGSRVTLEENGEKRRLVYTEPREGLDKAGIKKGTVLFEGERKPNGRVSGFAKIFKGTCNAIDYFVEGTLNEQKGEILLQGQAPVYSAGSSCEVSGYSDASPASTLKFSRIGDAPETAVVAERAPAQDVEQGDRGPADEYLPPAQRDGQRSAPDTSSAPRRDASPAQQRGEPLQQDNTTRRAPAPTMQSRNDNDPADIDESDPDARNYYRPRDPRYYDDRRYTRAPDPYDDRPYRRRPRIWDPEDDMNDEAYDRDYDRRPVSPFWGLRRPY